jgi:hypothetical protein
MFIGCLPTRSMRLATVALVQSMSTTRVGRRVCGRRWTIAAALGAAVVTGVSVAGAMATVGATSIDVPARAEQQAERGAQVVLRPPAPATARYRVRLVQEWSAATHPTTLPPGWHTSPAVLTAHARPADVFAVGELASAGVETMAETGGTALLRSELGGNANVGDVDTGSGIDRSGADSLEVTVTQPNSRLSLVTMLAPSPDWFVGFSGVTVFADGAWADRVVLDLNPYDAGTDSGARFTAGDIDTQPRQPVSAPHDAQYVAAAGEGRFGYVVIERIG